MDRIDGIGNLVERRDYAGSFVFEGESLTEVLTDVGRLIPWRKVKPDFFVRDHLGSVRAVVSGDGRVLETNNYYPYGMQIKPLSQTYYTSSDVKNRYKYNGKEEFTDNGLDWLAYGARFYDATTARWWVQDPKAEKYYALTPYNYVAGNPVNYIDYMGMDSISPDKVRQFFEANPHFIDLTLKKDLSTEEYLSKVADRIRNSPVDVTGVGKAMYPILGPLAPNPFKGAEAIYMDAGGVMGGGEKDIGIAFILVGKDKSKAVTYDETAGGGASEWSVGPEIGRIDYTGDPSKFTADMIYGERKKAWVGFSVVSGAVSVSKEEKYKQKVVSTSLGINLGISYFEPFSIGFNKGFIKNRNK